MEVDLCLLKKMSAEYAEAKNVAIKGPFDAHDMIEIGYDMKLDKDRK